MPDLETFLNRMGLSRAHQSVQTSFRISDGARETLVQLARRSGLSMKEEIDLIALDLFHRDPELRHVVDEFIRRDSVPGDASRRSQTISSAARMLIEQKAADTSVSRDQVLQQAIIFRAAMERYAAPATAEMETARAALRRLTGVASETEHHVVHTLGEGHWLATEMARLLSSLRRLEAQIGR